jgi:hypothetical protein
MTKNKRRELLRPHAARSRLDAERGEHRGHDVLGVQAGLVVLDGRASTA